ncbi:hypothetical protein immuto35A_199 [Flavobacterium phage vB_FspM_immuto_3-5A]|nr:hypothetical protein immuto35A_199 [Flavobacterium phage vB_FspM_immuto_3-5A]QQO92355.1 hypothetical protein immuto136C_199 [Flavobacterium phage vB_FspM_immuto_13-6C]
MRTLQEKYNAIQEGKFSKEHFIAEARMQHPQIITRFNGYDDAVQILKNKGMIQEAKVEEAGGHASINNLSKFHGITGDKLPEDKEGLEKALKAAEEGGNKRTAQEIRIALKKLNEARLTKNNLTDYRYKPTNEMDKYPYEQILRGLRVELEVAGVLGTPTAEEYAKALAKVSKNLAKDSIFYTNQLAGVNPKVDQHDQMVDATAKNTVDTFNGMKKAELKEGFKKLIKKVLSEEVIDVESYKEDVYEMYGEEDEIDYDDENFSDPLIDDPDFQLESTDTEADKDMVRKLMAMYETEPSKFEKLHKQAQTQASTSKDIQYKHLLSLIDRAKAGALQSLSNQDKFEADREGMFESKSLKDLL